MDLVDKFLDLVTPAAALVALFNFLPSFCFFKLTLSFLSSLFPEDIRNKVVLITGASSGIGEHLAYEYAKRGASLVLVARRANSLREIGERAKELGLPDVLVGPADVSVYDDCRRFVDAAISHFGRLDHLVTNAGIESFCLVEEVVDIAKFGVVMRTHGRIMGIVSSAVYGFIPRMSFYKASKAALLNFYGTLRMELGHDIGITTVTPGLIESEITKGKNLTKEGEMEVNPELRDVLVGLCPVERVEDCAKAIVDRARRRTRHITEPSWFNAIYMMTLFAPEVFGWILRLWYGAAPGAPPIKALSKRMLDATGAKSLLFPPSIQSAEIKQD